MDSVERKNTTRNLLFILLIIGFSVVIRLYDINLPFIRDFSSNGTHFGYLGLSHKIYSFSVTKGIPLEATGPLDYYENYKESFSVDHPPLVPVLILISYSLFGVDNWTVRFVPLLCFTLSLFIMYLLVKELLGELQGVCAVALAAIVPMGSYYSLETIHIAPTFLFILLSLFSYVKWFNNRRTEYYVLFVFFQCVALLTDWPGYYIAPIVFFHLLYSSKGKGGLVKAIIPIATNITIFLLYLIYIYHLDLQWHAPLLRLIGKLTTATGSFPGIIAYFKSESMEILKYFTVGLMILSAYGVFLIYTSKIERTHKAFIFLLPLISLDEIIFPSLSFHHPYLSFYLLPFLTMTSGFAVASLGDSSKKRYARTLIIVLVVAAILFQSGYIYIKRYGQQFGYPLQYELAEVIKGSSSFNDRVYTTIPFLHYYISFYAPRYVTHVSDKGNERAVSPKIVLPSLIDGTNEYNLIVTIHENDLGYSLLLDRLRQENPSREGLERALRDFGIEINGKESPLYDYLRKNYASKKVAPFTVFFINSVANDGLHAP